MLVVERITKGAKESLLGLFLLSLLKYLEADAIPLGPRKIGALDEFCVKGVFSPRYA